MLLKRTCPNDHSQDIASKGPTRRSLITGLGVTAGILAAGGLPRMAFAATPRLPALRELSLKCMHTGHAATAAYVRDGNYDAEAVKALQFVLKDWRTGDVIEIDRKLLDLLFALHRKVESSEPFQVISAYRSPKTNAKLAATNKGVAKKSLHMQGRAIDIRLPNRDLKQLHRAALDLEGGGVGLYTRSGFLHLDTGRVRRWGR